MSDHRMSDDYRQLLRGEISVHEYVCRLKADVDGRSPAGAPAHASGSESPDPSPDCPRCAALTRERDEALIREADQRSGAAYECARADVAEAVIARLGPEAQAKIGDVERDLAQARQALRRLSDAATTVWHQASVGTGYVTYNALEEIFEANAVAREALVETREKDLGGEEWRDD